MKTKIKTHFEIKEVKEKSFKETRRDRLLIKAIKVETTYNIRIELYDDTGAVKKQHEKWITGRKETPVEYQLTEISSAEISEFREAGVPSFLLKEDGRYWHAEIPRELTFISSSVIDAPHQCTVGENGGCCSRLEASPDPKGCEKVRNMSKRIERYDWITRGYETFNVKNPAFVVGACEHYERSLPKPKLSNAELNRRRIALAGFFFEGVETMRDVRRRISQMRNR